jgi:2-hydroxychromene-2-carboxylate isomerase
MTNRSESRAKGPTREAGIVLPAIKDRVKSMTEAGIEKGVFGSPFFLVEGEPFWGWDRIPMLEKWLESGSW